MDLEITGNRIVVNQGAVQTVFGSDELSRVIQKSAANVVLAIVQRAQANRQADGGMIKAKYSKQYRLDILEGIIPGKAHTRVNLTATGEFLQSLQVKGIPGGAKLIFTGSHAPSRKKKSNRKKHQQERIKRIRAAGGRRSARVKSFGGGGGKKRSLGAKGKSFKNVELLQSLQEMGYKGWFAMSDDDRKNVNKDLRAYIERHLPDVVETKPL